MITWTQRGTHEWIADIRVGGRKVWTAHVWCYSPAWEGSPDRWTALIRKEVSSHGNPAIYVEDLWPPPRKPFSAESAEAAKRIVEEVLAGWARDLAALFPAGVSDGH